MAIDKNKKKSFSCSLCIPLYYFLKERSEKHNCSMSEYINFLISKDVDNYINAKPSEEDLMSLQMFLKLNRSKKK